MNALAIIIAEAAQTADGFSQWLQFTGLMLTVIATAAGLFAKLQVISKVVETMSKNLSDIEDQVKHIDERVNHHAVQIAEIKRDLHNKAKD